MPDCVGGVQVSAKPSVVDELVRGFDLVEFDGDRIGWNEVYVHPL
jgi:hypothetical protein